MTEVLLWFLALAALPLVVVVASWLGLGLGRLRRIALACAGGLVVLACAALLMPDLAEAEVAWPGVEGALWGPSLVRTDALVGLLIPVAAVLWLVTLAVTPRSRLERAGIRRTACATLVSIAMFATTSPALLALLWVSSSAIYLRALGTRGAELRRARRVATFYLGASSALFVAGIALSCWPGVGGLLERVGLLLVLGAALIRKGIFPFHAWVPEAFERGALGPAVLFVAPQLGAYVMLVLVVPRASPEALRLVAILALITAVYGAALALIQRDARRALGYLFVSQSALIMAGLDCTSARALAGATTLWIASALAFAGIARCVLVLEARRGRLDLSQPQGGYGQTPALAISFLILGLACTGFPGTLGFVGEELLVDGATEAFPVLGFFVVIAGALTGLVVLRMYFSLFCGRADTGPRLEALRSERLVFGALAATLLAAGLYPAPLVRSRVAAAERLLERRGAQPDEPPAPAAGRARHDEQAGAPLGTLSLGP